MAFAFYVPHMLLINLGSNQKTKETKVLDQVIVLYNQNQEIIGYNLLDIELDLPVENSIEGSVRITLDTLAHDVDLMIESELIWSVHNQLLTKNQLAPLVLNGVENIVVGQVLTCVPHPDSDHLHITTVDVKDEILSIVCGAKNVKENIKVVVAKVGSMMFDGTFIEANTLRNVPSYGMICSGYELNLPNYQKGQGILILDDSYIIGEPFFK